jgi:hypothetical protein
MKKPSKSKGKKTSSAGIRTSMPPSKGKTKAPFGKVQRATTKKLKG